MNKYDLKQLMVLISCCVFIFIGLVFLGKLLASIIVYFKVNHFLFDWIEVIFISIKRGGIAGAILGIGIWIKSKLQEKKIID